MAHLPAARRAASRAAAHARYEITVFGEEPRGALQPHPARQGARRRGAGRDRHQAARVVRPRTASACVAGIARRARSTRRASAVETDRRPEPPLRRRGARHRQPAARAAARRHARPTTASCEPGVFVYRTMDDCLRMRALRAPAATARWSSAAGCSASKRPRCCRDLGLHVTVVHLGARPDERAARRHRRRDAAPADRARRHLRAHRRARSRRSYGDERVEGVIARRRRRRCRPTWWCSPAACARGSTWRAPRACRSTRASSSTTRSRPQVPGVYAFGECAEHHGKLYGLVAPVWEQAAVLADVLTGREAAGALPRLEAVRAAQGRRRRGRVDGRASSPSSTATR